MYSSKTLNISPYIQAKPAIEYMSAYLGAQQFFLALDYVFLMGGRYNQHVPANPAEQQLTDRSDTLVKASEKVSTVNAYIDQGETMYGVKITISLNSLVKCAAIITASFNERAELTSFGLSIG